jgi:hypothetical protein
MDRSHDEGTARDRGDERLVERIRAEWTPAPMTAFERTRFDAKLQDRLDQAHRRVGRGPALGAGLAAAAVAVPLLGRGGAGPSPTTPAPLAARDVVPAAAVVPAGWAEELLYATPAEEAAGEPDAALPEEYAAIAGVFLDL